jgi:hypothetical protein
MVFNEIASFPFFTDLTYSMTFSKPGVGLVYLINCVSPSSVAINAPSLVTMAK